MTVAALCTKCGTGERRENQRWCRDCHAAYARSKRKPYRLMTGDQRKKARCRIYSARLERLGYLVRQPCEVCGASKVERHHPDYSMPMYVRWLCREHHRALERGEITLQPPPPRQWISEKAFLYVPRDLSTLPPHIISGA